MRLMDEEVINKYKKAGEIAKKVIEFSKPLLKEGNKLLDVAESIENRIKELGGEIAFPTNISINSIAAHSTPKINDQTTFQKGDLVKLDLGVHIDGYIADTAYTQEIETKNWKDLISASEEALKAAIDTTKPEVPLYKIGEAIEETIKQRGFRPIINLSGHLLDQYELHAGLNIPNYNNGSQTKLEEGIAIAIEPFATNGIGQVIDSKESEIFSLINIKPVRMPISRKIIDIVQERGELPFCKRWLFKKVGTLGLETSIRELMNKGIIHNYNVLKEESNGMVAQAEHTILVLDKPIVTTL